MLYDITCAECAQVLGTAELDREPDGYMCEQCGYDAMGYPRQWLEFDHPIDDHNLRSPIPDFEVYATTPYRDVNLNASDTVTVSLLDHDTLEPSATLFMGVMSKQLVEGEATFSGLYVGAPGMYVLKLTSPGHDDVFSNGFEVT